MKKILFPLVAVAFAACNTAPHYTINGTVKGEQEGEVYLLKINGKTADTLASSPIKDGKFTLKGEVKNTTTAYLVTEGQNVQIPMALENAQYTAHLDFEDNTLSKAEGTESQSLLNQFMQIEQKNKKEKAELYKEYTAARQNQDEKKLEEIYTKFDELDNETLAQEEALIKANPNNFVSAQALASKMYVLDLEQMSELYNTLGEEAKSSEYGQKVNDRIRKLQAVSIGQVAPDFTQNTPDGKPLSLYNVKGKAKIIDFWASWCNPCRRANPEMVKIYKKYHPKGLEIIGVSLDRDKAAWEKAIADDNLTWKHVSDLQYWNNAVAQEYVVSSIPHILLLDENNTIVARNIHGEELESKIAELLQ